MKNLKYICGFIDCQGTFYATEEEYQKKLLQMEYEEKLKKLAHKISCSNLLTYDSQVMLGLMFRDFVESDLGIEELIELRNIYKQFQK